MDHQLKYERDSWSADENMEQLELTGAHGGNAQ